MPQTTILLDDALAGLRQINAGAVQCCVTSPPYFRQRDYGVPGQIGLEDSPERYVANLIEVFAEVRRTLADDGTMWLNIADTYASSPGKGLQRVIETSRPANRGVKLKDMLGIPWMLAFSLRADGWFLRSEIVWSKPNPMPESVRDRPTRSHEKVFLMSKSAYYYYDAPAVSEPATRGSAGSHFGEGKIGATQGGRCSKKPRVESDRRNLRDVWTVAPTPCREAHQAVMPTPLADTCIRAGSRPGDLILDPFLGAATTALAANRAGREAVGCELNPEYAEISIRRLAKEGYQADIF